MCFFFFFQAEDGIRDLYVTGVQTCALPIFRGGKGTARSDLYAFGCVVFECLTGKPPFGDRSMFQLAQAVLNETPPDPTIGRPDLPAQLYWVVLQALAKDPNHRPP